MKNHHVTKYNSLLSTQKCPQWKYYFIVSKKCRFVSLWKTLQNQNMPQQHWRILLDENGNKHMSIKLCWDML